METCVGPGISDGSEGAKRRRKRVRAPAATYSTYMSEGKKHLCFMRHRKALFCFEMALELQPDDPLALMLKSVCLLHLGYHVEALAIAEKVCEENPDNTEALFNLGEVLFQLGFFEKALMNYVRGWHRRPKDKQFVRGMIKAEWAIRTAIEDKAGTQIEDFEFIYPLILAIEAEENFKVRACSIRAIPSEEDDFGVSKLPPKSSERERWVSRVILGRFAPHKFFAKRVLAKSCITDLRDNKSRASPALQIFRDIYYILDHHERLMRWVNPMYARFYGLNFNSTRVLQYEREAMGLALSNRKVLRDAAEFAILKSIIDIEDSLAKKRYSDAALAAARALRRIRKVPVSQVPRKPEFKMDLLHYKGVAFSRHREYAEALKAFERERDLALKEKNDDVVSRSLDHTARALALSGDFAGAVDSWENRLEYLRSPLERAYTFHEIGRANLEMGKNEQCQYYANEAFTVASAHDILTWCVFSKILLGQMHLKSNQNLEAFSSFEEAAELAQQAGSNLKMRKMLADMLKCLMILIEKKGDVEDGKSAESMLPELPQEFRESTSSRESTP